MKLFLISQSDNTGYDTYDSAVVCAESAEEAQVMYPAWRPRAVLMKARDWKLGTWADSKEGVTVTYLGEAEPAVQLGSVCASFRAG